MIFKNMPTITFFLRSNKDKAGTSVLYCRVTINSTKSEFSTKEKILPEEWKQDQQKAICSSKAKTNYLNTLLDSLRYKLKTASILLESDNANLSAQELIKSLTVKKKQAEPLVELIKKYIDNLKGDPKKGIKASVAPGTIKNHEIKLKNLAAYQEFSKRQFSAENFDLPEAEKFKEWFMNRRKTKNVTTANRNVLFFAYALQWCAKKGLIRSYELSIYRGEKDPVKPVVYLSENEVLQLLKHQFAGEMLQKAKDIYLFQIGTGLSYGDIWSEIELQETANGKVMQGRRAKGNQEFFIPIEPIAVMILEKYNGKLPYYENGVYNRLLKEIAAALGINKKLTTHTGRKTFATLQESQGWSRESISMMLGHKSVKTTELYYLGKDFSRIENELRKRLNH